MNEPKIDTVLSAEDKALIDAASEGTFKLLRYVFKDSGSRHKVEIGDDIRTFLRTYYENMATSLRPVRLFHYNDTRWLDQVYVSLKIYWERENPFRGWDWEELENYIRQLDQGEYKTRDSLLERTTQRYDDTEILNTGKKLVIIGKPGSGKTTFLKHLSVSYIRNQVPELHQEFSNLPIFVYFRELAQRPEDIFTILTEQIGDLSLKPNTETFLRACLEEGLCMLLFDGLDEVPDRYAYDKVVSDIKRLCKQYPNNRFLLTSRPTGYFDQLRAEGFWTVEIEDMTPEQVRKFSRVWFASDASRSQEKAEALKEGFDQLIEEPSIKSLATNPLMLSLLALSYEFELALPKQRTQLFRNCMDALIVKWDASRGFKRKTQYEQLDNWHKKQLFYQVARKLQIEDHRLIESRYLSLEIEKFFKTEGIAIGDPEAIIKELEEQHGIIVEHAPHYYAFFHLGLQEYSAAEYYFSQTDDQEILSHISEPSWEEVLTFYASMVRADRLIDALLASDSKRKHQMAYNWLKQGISLSLDKRINILKWLNTGENLSDAYDLVPNFIAALPKPQIQDIEHYYIEKMKIMEPSYALIRELVTFVAISLRSSVQHRKRYIEILQTIQDRIINYIKNSLDITIVIKENKLSQQRNFIFFSAMTLALAVTPAPARAQALTLARVQAQILIETLVKSQNIFDDISRDQDTSSSQDQNQSHAGYRIQAQAQYYRQTQQWSQIRDYTPTRNHTIELDWDKNLNLTLALERTINMNFIQEHDPNLSRAKTLARDLSRALARDPNFDQGDSNTDLQKSLERIEEILTSSNNRWLKDLLNLSQCVADGIHAAQIAVDGISALQTLDCEDT